jgi:mRNA interferase MazF
MTAYSFGDVVLVPFPFADQPGDKQRPAVVISSARYQRERPDLILVPITSQLPTVPRFGDVPVTDTTAAGLLKPGVIKPVIFTLEASLVRKRLG